MPDTQEGAPPTPADMQSQDSTSQLGAEAATQSEPVSDGVQPQMPDAPPPSTEQIDPPAESTEPKPETPESTPKNEALSKEQRNEIKQVGATLISRKQNELAVKSWDSLSDAEKSIVSVRDLDTWLQKGKNGTEVPFREPVTVPFEGREVEVVSVDRMNDGSLRYHYQEKGQPEVQLVTQDIISSDLMKNYLAGETERLTSLFEGDQQKIVSMGLQGDVDGDAAFTAEDPEALKQKLAEVGKAAGLFSVEELVPSILAVESLTPEQKVAIQDLVDGKVVVEGVTFVNIAKILSPDIATLEANELKDMADVIDEGTLSLDQVNEAKNAIKSGDIQGALEKFIPDDPTDDDAAKALKAQQREKLLGIARGAGVGVGIFLIYMFNAMAQGAKSVAH